MRPLGPRGALTPQYRKKKKNNHKAFRSQWPVPQQGETGPLIHPIFRVLFASSKHSKLRLLSPNHPPSFSTLYHPCP